MNDNLARAVDAFSASPALRLRHRILVAKSSGRASLPFLPPALHPAGPNEEYEPFTRSRIGTLRLADFGPLAVLIRLRHEAAAEVERLLAFLDDTEGDLDLFEADPAEQAGRELRALALRNDGIDCGDREEDTSDLEPSFGWAECTIQIFRADLTAAVQELA